MGRKPKAAVETSRGTKPIAAMETRSARKVKLAEEGRPRRMLKVTEKARPIIKAKVAKEAKKTKNVKAAMETKARTGRKQKGSKVAEEPNKTMKRKAVEEYESSPFASKKKKTRALDVLVRRSGRLRNAESSVEKIQEKKGSPLEINLTDSDGEVELNVQPVVSKPTTVVGSPKLKRCRKPFASEPTQTVDYKTLYMDSQKKIEASREENLKRAIELSYLRGKVDSYEYIIGNMKNVFAFSNMRRATDAGMNLSDETAPDAPATNADRDPEPSPVNDRRLKKNKS